MKRQLSFIAGICLLLCAATAPAQTNTNTTPTLPPFLFEGTNYWATAFGTYAPEAGDFGFGFAVGYKISDFVSPMIRLDDFAGDLWVVSANLELQVPRRLLGKIPVTPFVVGGVATSFAGNGSDNGKISGVAGVGLIFDWSNLGTNSWILKHGHSAVDYERWFGLPTEQQNQIRFAPLVLHF